MLERGVDGFGEEGEHVTLLLSERVDCGHDARRKAGTAFALGAKALLAPEDKGAEFAFAVVV
jgi:hypothetical protein